MNMNIIVVLLNISAQTKSRRKKKKEKGKGNEPPDKTVLKIHEVLEYKPSIHVSTGKDKKKCKKKIKEKKSMFNISLEYNGSLISCYYHG